MSTARFDWSIYSTCIFLNFYHFKLNLSIITMANYSELFGETLLTKDGETSVTSLSGKVVGIYFSYCIKSLFDTVVLIGALPAECLLLS